jgi:hypothetical protein
MSGGVDVVLRLIALVVGWPLAAWAVGHALLARVGWLDRGERLAASWGVGFAVMALSQFLAFLTSARPGSFNALFLGAVLLVGLAACRFRPGAGCPAPDGPPVGLWLLALGYLAAVQALWPAYIGGGWAFDWWMHYEESLVFLHAVPVDTVWLGHFTVASRTPLYNLVLAFAMSWGGQAFWVNQLASVLTNSVFLLPAFLVLRDLFGRRAARLGMILAPLNIWIWHEAWFTWSKMLTCYYLLLALHFYLRWLAGAGRGAWLGFWAAALLGFMTHQVAAVYAAALLAHAAVVIWRDPARRPGRAELAAVVVSALAVVGPWYAWLAATFGPAQIVTSVPTSGMAADTPRAAFLPVYTRNLAATVLPDRLLHALVERPFSFGAIAIHLTALYFCQLPGALTLSLTVYLAWRALWLRRAGPAPRGLGAALAFLVLGGLGGLLLHPGASRYGLAHNAFPPSTLLLILLAWGVLARDTGRRQRLATLATAAESLAVFWSLAAWVYFYLHTGRITSDLNWEVQRTFHLVFLHDLAPRLAPLVAALCGAGQAMLYLHLAAWLRAGAGRVVARGSAGVG